jgi:hypothetical protein
MLHDPGSYSPPPQISEITLTSRETDTLRGLAEELANIAALPVHKEKARLWEALNDLRSERPMVWINEIPWNEMNVNDELTLTCIDQWARSHELELRKTLYQWKHMPGDMIINDFIECPLAIHSTDFGIHEEVDSVKVDESSDIMSRHFHIQIKEPEDIEKIKMPVIRHHEEVTDLIYETMCELYRDIIPVKKVGQTHIWFTPWDYLIRWWGLQEAMMDLIVRPEMVNEAVERMVDAWMVELDQFVEQNLLSLDCNNTRIGSGGYGYTSELPGMDYDATYVKPHNMWGCSNAQIFSEVSPEMHWEFALKHDLRWLERWGLTYYGCCEPLDRKIDLMKKIPNLRKISISPWNDLERVVKEVGGDYVLSRKPNPAIFIDDAWNPQKARDELKEVLDRAGKGCHIEFIMKDISTVRYGPERLWEWETIAMDVCEGFTK